MPGPVTYWKKGEATQNLGDYLSELFASRIQASDRMYYPRVHLVGSVISERDIRADLQALRTEPNALVGFWGCGQRDENIIDPKLLARCRFHGVRGPLTQSRLGLPAGTPIGDPALLLPLLHTYRPVPELAGRVLCVPHFYDQSTDPDILDKSGADLILRPNLPASLDVLLKAIDVICSVDFVLAGALHAAIIACAYGKPFAYYVEGHFDVPFKWLDFSASVNIPTAFVRNAGEGRRAWQTLLAPSLQTPKLTPILQAFPGEIQPGLLKTAQSWDLEHGHQNL
jgi:hypothetical protein